MKDGGVRNGDSVNEDTCRPPQNSVDVMENACDIALFIDGHDAGRVMGAGIFCRWWYHFALDASPEAFGSAVFQQRPILDAGPGMRLPESTNPLIVLKGGKPELASVAIGSGLHN